MQKISVLLVLSFITFISLGVSDGLGGVAWPGIRESFSVPIDAISLILLLGTAGYTLSSFASAALLRSFNIGSVIAVGVLALAVQQLVQGTAGLWVVFVATALIGGIGSGTIDGALNTYIAQKHSTSAMQWLHAFFGVGITTGPLIMTASVVGLSSWRPGYIVVGLGQLVLAALLFASARSWQSAAVGGKQARLDSDSEQEAAAGSADAVQSEQVGSARILDTLRQGSAVLSMLLFFLYTGAELGLGLWAYSLLTESRGVSPSLAGLVTGSYWGMFTLGRVLAGFFARRVSVQRLIGLGMLGALAGVVLLLVNISGLVDVVGIAIIGFSIAPIFPALVSDTKRRVGTVHEANTIGMQVAAAGFGSAIIPSVAGVLAREFSLEAIPLYILLIVLLLILGYRLSLRVKPAENSVF